MAYRKLSGEVLRDMREKWRSTRLLIIDEISMVSATTLQMVDMRLQEITGVQAPFGNLSIVVLGDFYQV